MKKKFLSLLLALAMCLSLSVPAWAVFSSSNLSTESPAVLSTALQEKEHRANEKYNIMLRAWAYDPAYIDDINADFPVFYGGMYIDSNKNLVIQVTDLSDTTRNYFAQFIDLTDVCFEEVKYSFAELIAEHDRLVKQVLESKTRSGNEPITGIGLSLQDNAINLYVQADKVEASTRNSQSLKQISLLENVNLIEQDGRVTSYAGEPGTGIDSFGSSIGIWAYDSDGNLGVVTAVHGTQSSGASAIIDGCLFGLISNQVYDSYCDAAFVTLTSTAFSASRYVSGWGFNLVSGAYKSLAEGATVYSKGATSICRTGIITDVVYTFIDDDSGHLTRNTSLTNAYGNYGDSGGLVAGSGSSSSRYFCGIIKGGLNNNMVFIKANRVVSDLDITVY